MTDEAPTTPSFAQAGSADPAALNAPSAQEKVLSAASGTAAERPELVVGAAFVGGFVVATILKRLVRST